MKRHRLKALLLTSVGHVPLTTAAALDRREREKMTITDKSGETVYVVSAP